MNAAVIIPAFEPKENLITIIDRIWELGNQIIVVDDGSSEDKRELFHILSEKAIIIHHEKNMGKGAAIKTAMDYIINNLWDCDIVGVMDADGQHLPEDMEKLLVRARCSKKALILGVRNIGKEMPLKSRIGNGITRTVFRMLSGVAVSDTQTGLRAFPKHMIEKFLKIEGTRYEYETNVLFSCAKEKIPIIEVPINTIYHDNNNSCSHFHAIRDSIRIYKDVLKFSISSLSSFVVDYIFFCLLTVMLPTNSAGILIANVAARMISGMYNYYMNCRYVFHSKKTMHTGMQYLMLAGLILCMNNLILEVYTKLFTVPVYTAKVLTEISLFIISFIIQKRMIFQKAQKIEGLNQHGHV